MGPFSHDDVPVVHPLSGRRDDQAKGFPGFFAVFFMIYNLALLGATASTDQGLIGGSPP
jgi:hypothetical protein